MGQKTIATVVVAHSHRDALVEREISIHARCRVDLDQLVRSVADRNQDDGSAEITGAARRIHVRIIVSIQRGTILQCGAHFDVDLPSDRTDAARLPFPSRSSPMLIRTLAVRAAVALLAYLVLVAAICGIVAAGTWTHFAIRGAVETRSPDIANAVEAGSKRITVGLAEIAHAFAPKMTGGRSVADAIDEVAARMPVR